MASGLARVVYRPGFFGVPSDDLRVPDLVCRLLLEKKKSRRLRSHPRSFICSVSTPASSRQWLSKEHPCCPVSDRSAPRDPCDPGPTLVRLEEPTGRFHVEGKHPLLVDPPREGLRELPPASPLPIET